MLRLPLVATMKDLSQGQTKTVESKGHQKEPRPSHASVLDESALLAAAMDGKYTDYRTETMPLTKVPKMLVCTCGQNGFIQYTHQ